MGSDIIIRLLGVPEISGVQPGASFPAKGFQLLALVCRSDAHRISRREAASLLWNSPSDGEALANLRQLLVRMRRAAPLGSHLIAAESNFVTLCREMQDIDLLLFERLTSNAPTRDIVRGLELFRGDLLVECGEATTEFSDWLARERGALRERFFTAAASALIELTRYGRAPADDLRGIARRLLAMEPEREASYRVLIEAYGRNGQFTEAEKLLAELKLVLRREFCADPAPETLAVARRVFASARNQASDDGPASQGNVSRPRIAFLAPHSIVTGDRLALVQALIEDVANELTRYRTFAVLAPHSSFKVHHDSGLPIDNSTLRADYTVSGFVKPDGEHEALALRMVNSASGEIVWAAEFAINTAELIPTFRTISVRVAATLAAALERDALAGLHRKDGSGSAYQRYLEGQIHLKSCDLACLRRARRSFRDALAVDRQFAPARARIAQTLYLEWLLLGGTDPRLLLEARQQAEATVELDPSAALGHWMSAVVALYQRNFQYSGEKFIDAETLNPNSADLLVQHADALSHFGMPDDGATKFGRALDLNPTPPDHYWWVGASIAFNRHRFGEAIDLCGRLENDEPVLRLLAASYAHAGDGSRARDYGRRLADLYPGETAADMVKLSPDRDPEMRKLFVEGLHMAGIP